MKKNIFKGIATALYTPFKNEGKTVDYAAFERLIERQLHSGINALVALGTTGESPTVSAEERKEIISFVVKRVNPSNTLRKYYSAKAEICVSP